MQILTISVWYDDYSFIQKNVVMLWGNNSRVIKKKRGFEIYYLFSLLDIFFKLYIIFHFYNENNFSNPHY